MLAVALPTACIYRMMKRHPSVRYNIPAIGRSTAVSLMLDERKTKYLGPFYCPHFELVVEFTEYQKLRREKQEHSRPFYQCWRLKMVREMKNLEEEKSHHLKHAVTKDDN